jgi:hypothetical protein
MLYQLLSVFGGITVAVTLIALMEQYYPSAHLAIAGCFKLIAWRDEQKQVETE